MSAMTKYSITMKQTNHIKSPQSTIEPNKQTIIENVLEMQQNLLNEDKEEYLGYECPCCLQR